MSAKFDQLCIHTIRALAMDAIQKAQSGHPGMPMGIADVAYVLWTRFLKHNPANPDWPNRDRFILSAGHGSMLLYSLLHLTGYDLPMEEIKRFRQWGSRTPGHPERELTPGVETTTGPLGQGFGNAVGMAIAERFMAATFNRPGCPLFDHFTYVIASDGDLMEGVSYEAASLAGHLGLNKLICFYDDNDISIEGSTNITFTEDIPARFRACHWRVQEVDGYDLAAIETAIQAAQAEAERPSLIICHTQIGHGSPNKQGRAVAHGAPLGEDEVQLSKEHIGWSTEERFALPKEALAVFRQAIGQGREAETEWRETFERYQGAYPAEAETLETLWAGESPAGWEEALPTFKISDGPLATRQASGTVLNALAPVLPTLVGGAADLAPSTKTTLQGYANFQRETPGGRNFHFGVREHGMGSIVNGMALYGGLRAYASTFLVFSDYMRPPVRMSALMGAPVIYVWTHDSVWIGEDGPTHQPVEHLIALRAIPNLTVIRPADANETTAAWQAALQRRDGPTALILTRQKLPVLFETRRPAGETVGRGAYVLVDSSGIPNLILIASGSEVHIALEARDLLAEQGIGVRVVSMPSWELFDAQPLAYRESVLPPLVKARLAIEAGAPLGWERYVGADGDVIGIDHFGASAPHQVLMKKFGFTAEAIAERALQVLARAKA